MTIPGHPVQPPSGAPDPDAWTSPLWGRPDTVGGYWPPQAPQPAPVPPPPPPRPRRGLLAVAAAVAVALLVGSALVATTFWARGSTSATGTQSPAATPRLVLPTAPAPTAPAPVQPGQTQPPGSSRLTPQLSRAAAAVSPGLVDIVTTIGYDGAAGAGTGVVLTSDGLVLTNHHVVAGATSVRATDVGNGRTYAATVLGYDRTHDVALLRLRGAAGLTTAPLGDSSTVHVGDAVVAVGNAGGVGGTPSAVGGTVTALDRSITAHDPANGTSQRLTGLVETDAAIRPGDSGGALADADGKVVGIVTAGSVDGADLSSTGDGFAVPVNVARSIAQQVLDGRASSTVHVGATAFLGIQVRAAGLGSGVLVAGVVPGSAAERAGIAAGDVVTGVDGTALDSPDALTALLGRHHPGDTVTVRWTDQSGSSHTADVRLGTGPVG